MRGPLAYPRRRLNPQLRQTAREAMRDRCPCGAVLALISGFPSQQSFSTTLHAPVVSATPLNVQRLTKVARIVGFDGPVFLSDGGAEGEE